MLLSRCGEVMSFVPPLNCCKKVAAKLFRRGKESAFAGVLQKVVLWNHCGQRSGDMAVMHVGGVCLVKVLANAGRRLLWLPLSMKLSPVVDVVLYSGVARIDDSGRGWM